jgi:predicted O-linked N-acetylglucosamine transferase (SPINDLY family)
LLAQAVAFHQAGRPADAEASYKKVLALNARNLDALNNLGTLYLQLGRYDEGMRLIRRSLEIQPAQPLGYMFLGNALKDLKRPGEALPCYDRAITLKPDLAAAYYNRGNAHADLRRHDEALADYEGAIALRPDYVQAHFNRANVLKEVERYAEAVATYDRAIALKPDFVEAYYNRGAALSSLNRLDAALADCERAIALKPDFAEAHYNRGNALHELGRLDEAVASYDRAVALWPDLADAHCNRGNVLKDLKRMDEALASYDRAIACKSDHADAWNNRGNALLALNRPEEAVSAYERALAFKPDLPYAAGSWLHARMHCCNWEGLDAAFAGIRDAVERGEKASMPFFFLAIPSSPALQQRCALTFARDRFPDGAASLWPGERQAHERIKVGYFSSDFRTHAMAYLIAEMIERHDRSRFEIIAFSFAPPSDSAIRRRLEKAFDRFVDVGARSDEEVAVLARQIEIDIAVDLNGFTANARTAIFARRPAPVQVSHLGYPGTMGAGFIDYIIGDRTVIPREHLPCYTEQVVHLPHTYWFNDSTKQISDRTFSRAELGLPDEAFVFCCFNNSYKLTPDAFDIWMRLLKQVDGSVLWLLQGNAAATGNLRAEAARRGISPERLVFAPRMALADHLARHRQADLFLDTFHYNAHTTTSDALWAGLPVVTCLGATFAGRVAASLLNAVGLAELVTRSHEEYEALAIDLARDARRLKDIKARLAENRLTWPLFDTALFTRHIEAAYTAMWARHRSGVAPAHIDISD